VLRCHSRCHRYTLRGPPSVGPPLHSPYRRRTGMSDDLIPRSADEVTSDPGVFERPLGQGPEGTTSAGGLVRAAHPWTDSDMAEIYDAFPFTADLPFYLDL